MLSNPLKTKLAQGKSLLGIWSIVPSAMLAEIIGLAGLDFQILDMEHGVYGLEGLDNSIRACESVGCSPLVRVSGLDRAQIQWALDLGAHGVIVPQVTTYEEVVNAISFMRYSPEGSRGYNPFTRAGNYGSPADGRSKLSNAYALSAIIIENVEAYSQLDRILAIPDLDLVYLGVYDMSVSLGSRGEMSNPRLQEFVETAIRKTRDAGKAVGLMVQDKAEIKKYLDLGANCLVYGVDTSVIFNAVSEAVNAFRIVRS